MFPVSFAPFFVFSLCVTDRCHQRKNKFQILCFTHKLISFISLLPFSHSLYLSACAQIFSQCAVLGFVIFQNTTHKKGIKVRIIY